MLGYEKRIKIVFIINISLNVCMIAIFLAIIIKYYTGFSEYEYIWFCSKILTVRKMIKNNNKKDRIFFRYYNGEEYRFVDHYLDFLKRVSKGECLSGYKKCGILDTYGNPFCVTQNTNCPVNQMIYDLASKLSSYQNDNYNYYTIENIPQLNLYYKNGILNNGVIVQMLYQESRPKYINENNFVFDKYAFEECFGDLDGDDDDDDYDDDDDDDDNDALSKAIIDGSVDFASDLIQDGVNIARIYKLLDYIDKKIKEDKNIDYNFTYINYNYYVKNYLGFENIEDAEDFSKINFSIYKKRYPDFLSMVFAIMFLIIFFILTIYLFCSFFKSREIKTCYIILIIVFYCPSFLGFYIYSIVIYSRDFKNETFELAKRIRADKFIVDFLKEFYTHFEKTGFIISIIVLLTFSALIFISIFIVPKIMHCIEEKKYSYSNRIIYFSNQTNERNQQNLNKNNNNGNNNNEIEQRITNENVVINSERELNKEDNKKIESNINLAENNVEAKNNNEKLEEQKNTENDLVQDKEEIKVIPFEGNNK